jgi:hypothetical protein
MASRKTRLRFNRRIVAFALFVLVAFTSLVVLTLVAVPAAQNASLEPQSALVVFSGERPAVAAAKSQVPSTAYANTLPRHGHQP